MRQRPRNLELLWEKTRPEGASTERPSEATWHDVEALLDAFRLQQLRRFHNQRHWKIESAKATLADGLESGFQLENVAAHSWHVADISLLISPQFADLDPGHVACAAILHDKLEMIIGDYDPVGADGLGTGSHAFDANARRAKHAAEQSALDLYSKSLHPLTGSFQSRILQDLLNDATPEARFVKAIDKIQALAFVYTKKRGHLSRAHLDFTARYSAKAVTLFPRLHAHYATLLAMLADQVSGKTGMDAVRIITDALARDRSAHA